MTAIRFLFVVGATYIYSGSNNERESPTKITKNNTMMNTDFRYQLESKRLTGHQPHKLSCPHCGKRKCFVRYVDTKNNNSYVAVASPCFPTAAATRSGAARCSSPPASPTTCRHDWSAMRPTPTWPTSSSAMPTRRSAATNSNNYTCYRNSKHSYHNRKRSNSTGCNKRTVPVLHVIFREKSCENIW